MARNYWITTKWPPYEHDEKEEGSFNIALQDGRENEAKEKLENGDLIFIYQLKTGPVGRGSDVKRKKGYGGLIALVKAKSGIQKDGSADWIYYEDGSKRCWRWYAETENILIKKSIRRKRFNRLLGYDTDYTLRGFGKDRSGLKNITKGEFCRILKIFSSKKHK